MSLYSLLHAHLGLTMGPLSIVAISAVLVMLIELLLPTRFLQLPVWLSLLGLLVALVDAFIHLSQVPQYSLDTLVSDGLASILTCLILLLSLLLLLFHVDELKSQTNQFPREGAYLFLFATAGALAMVTAVDLVTLYVGLELLSVSSYILVAMTRKRLALEGGMKYLVLGGVGSALFLYGASFIYGMTGQTNLYTIARMSHQLWLLNPAIVVLSFLLMLCGLGVKLSLVPFHYWTPDAYEGASASVAGFLASVSKSATFAMTLRVLLYLFLGSTHDVFPYVAAMAALTMVAGNLLALGQNKLRRLLAVSSVAQAGYLLIPIALLAQATPNTWPLVYNSLVFYLVSYSIVTIGAFAVLSILEQRYEVQEIADLSRLPRQYRWLRAAFACFLLGFAGMPLTSGFMGKLYLLIAALRLHELWLGVLLFAVSVISFYYYLKPIRTMYQKQLFTDNGEGQAVSRQTATQTVIAFCVLVTLLLGVWPGILLQAFSHVQWY
ncbi:NADH-quinone oxidoreductase subunit N [Alicyclobacillus tolerans]|uniref:NADH-quinone oxidoreductase subunit N n=1 Tax=Alicyclobacillus tolerans TaxID=90970 RepID=UPI003B7E8F2D